MQSNPAVKSFPLSSVQREIWFDQTLHPDIPLYNIGGYTQIFTAIDPQLFEAAVHHLITRHDALRTRFVESSDEGARQTFDGKVTVDIPFKDFSSEPDPHQAAIQWSQQQFVEPFALQCEPLARFALVKESDQCFGFLAVYHHLITDGWGISMLHRQLGEIYTTLIEQVKPDHNAPSYSDFIENDRKYVESARFNSHKQYWLDKYQTLPEPLFGAADGKIYPSERQVLSLPRTMYNQLEALAKDHDATTFQLILAVLYVYFCRTSETDEVAMGLPVLNRGGAAFKQTAGLFVGVSAARFSFGCDLGFDQLLQKIGQELKHNYRHQRLPISELNREITFHQTGQQGGLQRLFDIGVSFEKHDHQTLFAGATTHAKALLHGFEQAPLMVYVREFNGDEAVDIDFVHNLGFVSKTQVKQIQSRFMLILGSVLKDPQRHIRSIDLLGETEQQQIRQWNHTETDFPRQLSIAEVFEQQVKLTPDNIAVIFGGAVYDGKADTGQKLTYQQLNAKANQLAHYLMAKGVGAESLVGICVDRSLEMLIGILAILKAGGGYLPLDPDYPASRLAYLLEDSGVKVLLSQTHLLERLTDSKAEIIDLNAQWPQIASCVEHNPPAQSRPDNLAYVIYTSGSTGNPKGVMVEQLSVVNMITGFNLLYHTDETDVVLQQASFSFDVSVGEIFPIICRGGVLAIPTKAVIADPQQFAAFVERHQVTIFGATPSLLSQLHFEQMPQLRLIFSGGEALSINNVEQLFETATIVNGYGPTEATIGATAYTLSPELAKSNAPVPIGKPVTNYQTYILDSQFCQQPVGVPGELFIGGVGVARGYLNRPELSAEKFVEVELFGQARRLYQTGDRACWGDDGNLYYLGRIDQQVKLRGYRIELGEVESALGQHPAVKEAVVTLHERNQQLVGYLTKVDGADEPTSSQLSTWLKQTLPDYMVPAAFMVLDKMPLTGNGKVDRKVLPAPDWSMLAEAEVIAPTTQTEKLLCVMWSDLLGIEVDCINSHFFALGGHSLLATQLASRIRTGFDIELALNVVFEHPRLGSLATHIDSQQRGFALDQITTQNAKDDLVLSYAQQRLWFLSQLAQDSEAYNMFAAMQLTGDINEQALQQALECLVQKHQSLGMCFPEVQGNAVLNIIDGYNPLTVVELAGDEAQLNDFIVKQSQTPFDLATGPLFRVHLVKQQQKQLLLFNMHHIISDGWSLSILVGDLSRMYTACLAGQSPAAKPAAIQYSDYAHWQKQWLQGDVLEQQLDYWREQLADIPELLQLPSDYPRPTVMKYHGQHFKATLAQSLHTKVKQLSQQQGTTLFMTLLSAFNVLLCRYSAQDDVVVGSPVANRNHHQSEQMVGLFVNTLVLRSHIDLSHSFADLLKQVRQTTLAAYSHQDIPFEMLVDELKPARDLSYSPLFQVMFGFQDESSESLQLDGVTITPWVADDQPIKAKFDLTLSIAEQDGSFVLNWEYCTELFKADTIARMSEHFAMLLAAMVENPEQPIAELPMLTSQEQGLIIEWNNTEMAIPYQSSVIELFEAQVAKTPQNTALVFADVVGKPVEQLSYQQLNTKANQLAHYLMDKGVGADTLVGICVERSLEMVIGILAILKAGGAYLPMDPNYPADRLAYLKQDSGCKLVLDKAQLSNSFAHYPGTNPPVQSGPDNLAYVIYTSGSTGQPKGVMIEQVSVVNMIVAFNNLYETTASDKVLQQASFAFDVSVGEIFPIICQGGALVVPTKAVILDPVELSRFVGEHQISIFGATPSLLSHLHFDQLPHLRLIFSGGEALSLTNVEQLFDSAMIVNGYGPTEATIGATAHRLKVGQDHSNVPIGMPVPNYQTYILDSQQNQQPLGVPGELYIGGIGLARGYLNRLELTAQKFVDVDVFGQKQRLYKTGDLAAWLESGEGIVFLGRVDDQIKLRGFRIELGEIESILLRHERIKTAAVILYEKQGNSRLVAYVTLDQQTTDSALKDWLKQQMPHYMVPSNIIIMDKLPLTANGKIDRKALPEPDLSLPIEDHVPLITKTERRLGDIWTQLLGESINSANSGFFEIGGHSLLATQLAFSIRQGFGIDMPLAVIFEKPLLSELAGYIDSQRCDIALPPITAQPANETKVLSYAQQRLWFLTQLDGDSGAYNMPAALHIEGELDEQRLRHALVGLVTKHQSLRMCFPATDGQATVQINDVYDPLQVVDLTNQPLSQWIAEQALMPFDLANGPLLRLHLLKQEQQQILLFNMHHIISDGWSMGVLVSDLGQVYNIGTLLKSMPAAIQYSDYAHWQRQWLQGDVLEQQLDYWRNQLAEPPELLQLPSDFPRPTVMKYDGNYLQRKIGQSLFAKVKKLSQQQGTTLFMTLLSAFNVLLCRYSGQDDVAVGSPVANRTHHQSEQMIGLFVNTLVLRNQIDLTQGFAQLLKQVRQTTLAAYAHQDIPFEMLVDELKPARDLSYSPLFQVMFGFQNESGVSLQLDGVTITPWVADDQPIKAKFDLTLSIAEQDGGFVLNWEYCTELFKADTIERMNEHFAVLLAAMVENPEQPMTELPMLTPQEQDLIIEWNNTEMAIPRQSSVIELFEAQVAKTPQNIALVFADIVGKPVGQLTYQQLNAKANQLAYYLMESGVGAETLVGICVERSLEMVIGIVAILKAGGAYLPMDPDYPADRLAYLEEDSGCKLVLDKAQLNESLYSHYADTNPPVQSGPDNLAYVIYTSGSTGKPKGVMIEQVSVVNMIVAFNNLYDTTADDKVLQQASFAFDVSVGEIFPIICQGGALVVPTKAVILDPAELSRFVGEHQISIFGATPSLLSHLHFDQLPHLRLIFSGGEALSLTNVEQLFDSAMIVNGYGPTEATIGATAYRLKVGQDQTNVPIGMPVPNYQTYILNSQQNQQPLGVPGELYIGGIGLARGYLNRPELTAEKFIDVDVFGKKQRLYKTGDLAAWLGDGEGLTFLGRVDDQIKLRGFRIELGEIESILQRNEHIKTAAVILYEKQGNSRLVAYVTLSDKAHQQTTEQALKDWLKQQMPHYMVPSNIIVMDKLPLTPNGKINRKALPQPQPQSAEHFETPRTDVERNLLEAWSQVLKQDDIGIHDNFFERGGDSILIIQVVSRAKTLGLAFSPRDLFAHQTIASLAEVTRPVVVSNAEQGLVSGQMPLGPIQQAYFSRKPSNPNHYNQAGLLTVPVDINLKALKQAFATIIEHHDALRLRFVEQDGGWLQWHDNESQLPWHVEDLSGHPEQQQVLQTRLDFWQQSLDLAKGPIMRVVLFDLGDQLRLFWCIHHLVVDGVSWRILMTDLQMAYHQAANGQKIKLPAKSTSFKAWTEALHLWQDNQADYWRKLNDHNPTLPVDYPEGSNNLDDAVLYPLIFSQEVTQGLLSCVPKAYGCQINEVLLTVLMLTLTAWTESNSHLIDLESHGRADIDPEIDLSNTVGWFTAMHTVSLNLQQSTDVSEATKTITKQLAQVPDNGIGYGVLRHLKGEALPHGQILFNYLGQMDLAIQDSLFALAQEPCGQNMSLTGKRDHLIEINGQISGGQLGLSWGYSKQQYDLATIEMLANRFSSQLQTIVEQAQVIYQPEPDLSTLVALNGAQQKTSLYIAPGSGSMAGYLRTLAARLSPDLAVYGLQSPGLDGHAQVPQTVEALAAHHIKVIRHVQPQGPYYLAGHSFGTAVAFDMARQLEQAGQTVARLVILDQPTRALSILGDGDNQREPMDWVMDVAMVLQSVVAVDLPVSYQTLRDSNDLQYVYMVLMNWLKDHGGDQLFFGEGAGIETLKALVKIYQANALSFVRYQQSTQKLNCPIAVYCAEESLKAVDKDAPEDWGWGENTRGPVEVYHIPGEHTSMFGEPFVEVLAAQLKRS